MKIFLKNKKVYLILLFAIFYLLFSFPAQAQESNQLMLNVVEGTPVLPQADLIGIIFRVIQYILMFVGVVAVVIVLYGGFLWMTARGNDEQVNKAKKVLINGLIGLVVVLLSYAIVGFAIGKIEEVFQPPGQVCTPAQCVAGCWRCNNQGNGTIYDSNCPPCGAGGQSFVLRWTWPKNNQEGITVCSLIQAGFNEKLDESSVNENNIQITLRDAPGANRDDCLSNTDCKSGQCQSNQCLGNFVSGEFIVVEDVFKFKAQTDFEKETWYRVLMTTSIRSFSGRNLNAQRIIEFKTSSEEDTLPPTVESVYPENEQEGVCLLDPVQVIFSEAMDVTTLLHIEALITNPIHEFRRSALNEKTLEANPRTSYRSFQDYQAILNADIIADVCGNKLDGNNNQVAEGSPIDDYAWSFKTGDTLYCQPIIDSLEPVSGYYNDQLIIRGNYFKLIGEIVFNRQVYPNDFCFNDRLFPNQTCLLSWTNNEIRVKVPAAGGASQGTVSGPVKVLVGEVSSNSKAFNLQSPYLQSFTPSQGGREQAITLSGINFGNNQGKVYFIPINNSSSKINGHLICDEVGWRDYQVIVAVPQFIDLGNYYLQIERADGRHSNVRLDEFFEVTNQEPGPTLCDIKTACPNSNVAGGKPGEKKYLFGHRFGTDQGLVNFNSISAEILEWDQPKISINVPAINPATYQVRVALPNFKESNPIAFVSPCFEQGSFADPCFLNETTCLLEKCNQPYQCKSSSNGDLECRCCCSIINGCPASLECDETQVCYRSGEIEITGACCGCTSTEQCANYEICKQQGPEDPFCCFACQLGDEGEVCQGGQCCSKDCDIFVTEGECLKRNGCSWNNLTCSGGYDPYCCRNGRCVDHQCLSLCGDGQIDPGEECDPGPPENLNGKTCQLLGYQGGTLRCSGTCKFMVNDCLGAGGSGDWGEKCINQEVSFCTGGRDDCSLAQGTRCVQNINQPPYPHCACCCQPGDPVNNLEDSCQEINNKLFCSLEKTCGDFGQRGMCCGCAQDIDCGDYMYCGQDQCCYSFFPPTNLKFLTSSKEIINLSWNYAETTLATHFEIWKKDPGENNFNLLTTCEISATLICDQSQAELRLQAAGLYNFQDQRGNFETNKDYAYQVRTRRATTYSRYAGPAIGQVSGLSVCQKNLDCPSQAPCCRLDNNVCVDWNNCQGSCFLCADYNNEGECNAKLDCQWSDQGCLNKSGNNCRLPAVKFAVHDFLVTNRQIGPCLKNINPRQGKIDEAIILDGLRFGQSRGLSEVTFAAAQSGRINAHYPSSLIWQDNLINYAQVPRGADDGEVRVMVNNRESNGLWFNFIPQPVGPGDPCFYKDVCQQELGSCPPAYPCLVDNNDCRCCCDPITRGPNDPCKGGNPNSRLECTPNRNPCTGDNRGLCCGCLKDADCGDLINIGCGMIEPTPMCCYPRPKWENIFFCDNTSSQNVKLNSDITLIFDKEMDFRSLDNNNNLKVSRLGNCLSIEEGNSENGRCYLSGSIVSKNEEGRTETIFSPSLCQLQPNTIYKIELLIGFDGQGVSSNKGVALNNSEDFCSWNRSKCQIREFTTRNDQLGNELCEIQWIDVQPRNTSLRELNKTVTYQGIARDKHNKAVCVNEFQWQAIDEIGVGVASLSSLQGKTTIATSKAVGRARIIASTTDKTCNTNPHTCGLLNVSLEGPKIIKQKTCEVCNLGGQSPSPWQSTNPAEYACQIAQVVARFDKEIRNGTLNNSSIIIEKCEEDLGVCLNPIRITGAINSFEKGFYFTPNQIFEQNKVYRVTLKSGLNGIKDINGLELDGNENGIQDGSPSDDYLWYFKVRNDDLCPLAKVCVEPQKAKITHAGNQRFQGLIYTQNCNYLNPDDYQWQWFSSKPEVAVISLFGQGRSSGALVTSNSLGITKIKGMAQGQADEAELVVATVPLIEETYPSGNNLCLNTAVFARFDQLMDQNSFFDNFKIESEDAGNLGMPRKVDETNNFNLRFVKDTNNKTIVYFTPKKFLNKLNKYYLTIYGANNDTGRTGVKSVEPYTTKMDQSKQWTFITGEIYCRLDRVLIEPTRHLFTRTKMTKDFLAKTYYGNIEIQGIPGWYDWSWQWNSSNQNVVKITNSNNSLQQAESQSQNGLADIIAQAKITVDQIFKPRTVNKTVQGSAQVETWLCENPWPCSDFPNCLPYEDKDNKTNFEFKYCRDAGPVGLIGDLPILKGGLITGVSEPGVEKLSDHFFSVYDGSLSFLYDGTKINIVKPAGEYAVNKSGYNNSRYDVFGNNNALVRGDLPAVSGKFGQAFSFNGASYLSVNFNNVPFGRNATIETNQFTLETWIKTQKRNNTQSIFKKEAGLIEQNGYSLEIREDGWVYFWLIDQAGNKVEVSADLNLPNSGVPTQSDWIHLAAIYDSKTLKIYINGLNLGEMATAVALVGGLRQADTDLIIGQNFIGLLDEISFWQKALTKEEIAKYLQGPIEATLGDVIGLKVFSNFGHLKAEEWCVKNALGCSGSGSVNLVDNYRSYQEGRTVYVAATNVVDPQFSPKIYTNIYLISQSDNPQAQTSQIFRQSINNWKFNTNKNVGGDYLISSENKLKIIRDLQRIYDLKIIWQTLERYKSINTKEPGSYPQLKDGTFITGMSTSKWPSWTAQTGLGQDLIRVGLSLLPNDPVNKFSLRDGCGGTTTPYKCCADCPRNNPDCTQTCYNSIQLPRQIYECYRSPDGENNSQIYQYINENLITGTAYSLYANFEYSNPDNWQHESCRGLNMITCESRTFCVWRGLISYYNNKSFKMAAEPEPLGCEPRRLNYYYNNPCQSLTMNCACFNAKFSSRYVVPLNPPEINFYADRTQIIIGEPVTLNWNIAGADDCLASATPDHSQWDEKTIISLPTGSLIINNLQQSINFNLICSGPGGQSQKIVYINVIIPSYNLSVAKSGTGSGTVTSNPTGINCGSTCSASYSYNTQITLSVTPAVGSTFTGWSGACTGSGTCTVTMDNAKSVTANFNLVISYIYAAGGNIGNNQVWKINRSTMNKIVEETVHDGGIYALAEDEDFIYAAGGSTRKVWKIKKSDMVKVGESSYHDSVIRSLAQDENYVYAGDQANIIRKIRKSDMVVVSSSDIGRSVYALIVDDSYVYAGDTAGRVWKIRKSDLMQIDYHSRSSGTIYTLAQDSMYIYAAGTSNIVWKIPKTNINETTAQINLGTTINALAVDTTYVYAGGTGEVIWKINKNMSNTGQSINYGGDINAITVCDEDFVYAAGGSTRKVWKIKKSDMVKVGETINYASEINALSCR